MTPEAPRPSFLLAFLILALVPSALTACILWLAPISGLTADRAALAARDYTAFWGAGRAVIDHSVAILSNPASFTAFLRSWFGVGLPDQIWPYPPPILLLATPFAYLPLAPGFALYTAATVALLGLVLRLCGQSWSICLAVMLSPAVAENALVGQNGALTAALLVGGLLLLDRRPIIAGALLGALVIKPQLGLILPFCMIAGQRWRVVMAASASAVSIVSISIVVFGFVPWVEYLSRAQPMISAYIEAPWQATSAQLLFTSTFMAARSIGADLATAYGAQAVTTLACARSAWRIWRTSDLDRTSRMAATVALSLLAAPWVHAYDMPALAAAIAVLVARCAPRGRALFGFAWLFPGLASLLPAANLFAVATIAGVAWQTSRGSVAARTKTAQISIAAALLMVTTLACRPVEAAERSCDAAAAKAERDWNVPAGVLSAVGAVESGRQLVAGGTAPWPWTINAAGHGAYFGSKAEAVAAVLAIMTQGYPYIDVGCFQIDLAYHTGIFHSLDDAFDPDQNAQAAARILAMQRLHAPDWPTAVARYHSATPELGGPYLERVRAALPAARLRGANSQLDLAVANPVMLSAPSTPDASLPRVIYPAPVPSGHQPQIIHLVAGAPPHAIVVAATNPRPPPLRACCSFATPRAQQTFDTTGGSKNVRDCSPFYKRRK